MAAKRPRWVKRRKYAPTEAQQFLEYGWKFGDLASFVGPRPADFGSWTAQRNGGLYTFHPPAGGPGLEIDTGTLHVLVARSCQRWFSEAYVHPDVRTFVRGQIPKGLRRRYDKLTSCAFWRAAEATDGIFFFWMAPLAAESPTVAAEILSLHSEFERRGLSLLQIAEPVIQNFLNAWLCERFLIAIENGKTAWRTRVSYRDYARPVAALLKRSSPFSESLKQQLASEAVELRGISHRLTSMQSEFFTRKAELESAFGSPFFGRTIRGEAQQRPYFRQEILNIVDYIETIGRQRGQARQLLTRGRTCKLTARLLCLIAGEWYRSPDKELVRRRYESAKRAKLRANPPPPLRERPSHPRVRVVPD